MSDALSTALSGITAAVSRATQSAINIVNASSTGKNLAADLVNLKAAGIDVAANVAVIKTENKNHKALLDIKV